MTHDAMRLSPDFGIRRVRVDDVHPEVQLVIVLCGCLGVWCEGKLVGFAEMCEAHTNFKALANVSQSRN